MFKHTISNIKMPSFNSCCEMYDTWVETVRKCNSVLVASSKLVILTKLLFQNKQMFEQSSFIKQSCCRECFWLQRAGDAPGGSLR